MADRVGSGFVQYLMLRVDPAWRRLDESTREAGRSALATVVTQARGVQTFAYSTLGLKAGVEVLLWLKADSPEQLQDLAGRMLQNGMGQYCQIAATLWGVTRPSMYTKTRTAQEDALGETQRLKYLIVYPFAKTADWYLMSRDARQGMMNEHMRVGHDFADVRQILLYSTGLDDHEFVVAYETDKLERQHELVVALRGTEGRRHTLRDTPIYTAIHRSLDDALSIAG
jgi:chlorite dismutase